MVLLFLIASLQGGTPNTLYYKYFNSTELFSAVATNEDETRKTRKVQVTRVIERLHSVSQFYNATTSRNLESDMQILNSDDVVPEFEVKTFRLLKNDPFCEEMRMVWAAVSNVGVALVCHRHENRLQAEITLRILVRQLHELCRFILQPNEILTKPEKTEILLEKFMPDGNLLLMNHRVIRQLQREAESLLKSIGN